MWRRAPFSCVETVEKEDLETNDADWVAPLSGLDTRRLLERDMYQVVSCPAVSLTGKIVNPGQYPERRTFFYTPSHISKQVMMPFLDCEKICNVKQCCGCLADRVFACSSMQARPLCLGRSL